jgi:hypothetical protein
MSEQIDLKANNKDIVKPDVDFKPSVDVIPEYIPNAEDIKKVEDEDEEEEKEEGKAEIKTPEILLKLGDVILITDPTNEILNNNVFLIEYIDPSKIKLINGETYEKTCG